MAPFALHRALASIGEETGYGGGWGTVWPWNNRPTAPEEPTALFREYLEREYGGIAALNASWDTDFPAFDSIPLEKRYVEIPREIDTTPLLTAPRQGRWVDTRRFFLDYARRWATLAQEEFRALLPMPRTVYGFGNYLGLPAELVTEPTPETPSVRPGFSMAWWPFANLEYLRGNMWGLLASHVGHQAGYTADLSVNYDLSPSPFSLASRQFMAKAGRIAPLILQSNPLRTTLVQQYTTWQQRVPIHGHRLLRETMRRAGMPDPVWAGGPPAGARFLYLPAAVRMTPEKAGEIRDFAAAGGVVLATVNLALEDVHGNLFPTLPGEGLQTLTGVRQSAPVGSGHGQPRTGFVTPSGCSPVPAGLRISARGRDPHPVILEGTRVLARFDDGVPAMTRRDFGRGTVYWVNVGEGGGDYGQLLLAFAAIAGAESLYSVTTTDGGPADLTVVPYRMENGSLLSFVCIRRATPGPGTYRLTLKGTGWRVFDGGNGTSLPVLRGEGTSTVTFGVGRGDGRVITAVPYRVTAAASTPPVVRGGEPVPVDLALSADAGAMGTHVATVTVTGPDGLRVPAFERTVVLGGAARVTLATALNDRPGEYILCFTDLATNAVATAHFRISAPVDTPRLPRFRLGWPSEELPYRQVADDRFLDELRRLAMVYLTPGVGRFRLSYYQQSHGDSRHNLMMELAAVDWRRHESALRNAIAAGMTVVLTGEDLGVNPSLGFDAYPHADGHQQEVVALLIAGVTPQTSSARPSLRRYRIGRGELIIDGESWDERVWVLKEFEAFHRQWLEELCQLRGG